MTNNAVYGIFATRMQAEQALDRLKSEGFRKNDISLLQEHKTFNEGESNGPDTGVLLGGAVGWLAGFGFLAIPGVGAFIAAGPLMSAIGGAAVGGALGGVVAALGGFGVPRYEAHRYEGYVLDGGILVSVHSHSIGFARRAKRVLEQCGATDIGYTSEKRPTLRPSGEPGE
jgi:hypothetical protein